MYEQLIQVVDCLTEEEVNLVFPQVKSLPFVRSTVFKSHDGTESNGDGRTSCNVTLPENVEICNIIHRAMNRSLIEYSKIVGKLCYDYQFYPVIGSYRTKSFREGIQVLRYESGQEYKYHHDTHDYPTNKEFFRTFSIVVYLNDDFEGGGTDFVHRYYKPKAGQAVVFPSNWMFSHSGTEVISGTKYVAVTWYYVTPNDYMGDLPAKGL